MLSGLEIKRQMELGNIVISDFDEKRLNPNSYNVRLGDTLKIYKNATMSDRDSIKKELSKTIDQMDDELASKNAVVKAMIRNITTNEYKKILRKYALDPKKENETIDITIPEEGYVLMPGTLYLGTTVEYTETYNLVPNIDGRSTSGRLGIEIHRTAGFGDNGFKGKWTLEITVTHPVIVYPGMEIAQIYYETIEGDTSLVYNGKYQNQQTVQAAKVDKEK